MSNRLDIEREQRLQPLRMADAINAIEHLGYTITFQNETTLQFIYKGSVVTYWPYSGWASGKSIKDGRGLERLLNQIK